MAGQTILILGGGIGGVVAANRLRKRLHRRHRVILVDREPSFALAASFLWVMTGDRRPEQISRPLARLARKGIEVVVGEVQGIDPERRQAVVDGQTLTADHLVVALGAEFAPDSIPGLAEAGLTFCTLDGAVALRDALVRLRSGRIVVLTAAPAYKCPAAPYEAALLIDGLLRRSGQHPAVELELHTAEAGPMGVAGPEVSAAVRAMVEQQGIPYRPEHQITRTEAHRVVFADGTQTDFELLVYVPSVQPPRVLRDSGLADETGWVRVDRHSLETRYPRVYAVGDVTLIPLALGRPLPRAGVFAHAQAEVVARNIAAAVNGQVSRERFSGWGACFIETGGGRAGYGAGDFYAEPRPVVRMRHPGRLWHLGKVLFEKQVMWQWL
ncbi:MAG: FAD-dependent oxidoreductase [Candidatus Latescibacterota bacterium]|jgi:sulfide:quinone oxidoreductase